MTDCPKCGIDLTGACCIVDLCRETDDECLLMTCYGCGTELRLKIITTYELKELK